MNRFENMKMANNNTATLKMPIKALNDFLTVPGKYNEIKVNSNHFYSFPYQWYIC